MKEVACSLFSDEEESTPGEGSGLCQFMTQKVQPVRRTLRTRLIRQPEHKAWRGGSSQVIVVPEQCVKLFNFIGKIKGS